MPYVPQKHSRVMLRHHTLKGGLKGYWSLTVTGNWRLIFQYDAATNTASSLDLIDYHGK